MKIENARYRLTAGSASSWLEAISLPFASALGPLTYPLRFSVMDVDCREVVIEATVVSCEPSERYANHFRDVEERHE